MQKWAVITGAGTGIGATLAKELADRGIHVLAVGRRKEPLEEVKKYQPAYIHSLSADIGTEQGINNVIKAVPQDDQVQYLVQNAAVGVPARLLDIQRHDFEYAMAVNVTAPLMLTKAFLPRLQDCRGRIMHLGTGVAFRAQLGTTTYGVTKMAFHRLFEQLKVELEGTGVGVASALPGVVDTPGLREHIILAKEQQLPHVQYFDQVEKSGEMLSDTTTAKFLAYVLLETKAEDYSAEWHINDKAHWHNWKQANE